MQQAAEAMVAAEVAPPCLDVTLALRYMTQDSRITFHQVTQTTAACLHQLERSHCCYTAYCTCPTMCCCCCLAHASRAVVESTEYSCMTPYSLHSRNCVDCIHNRSCMRQLRRTSSLMGHVCESWMWMSSVNSGIM